MNDEPMITIPLEEYKELLIMKGKYEQLKEYTMPHIYPTTITYDGKHIGGLEPPYKITCATYDGCEENTCEDDVA